MKRIQVKLALAAVCGALVLSACGPGRTAAWTQPTPAAFDATQSDPKAVELVDKMVATLGGADKWDAVKQLRWQVTVAVGDDAKGVFAHAWDRWNGRHRFQQTDVQSMIDAKREGDPKLIKQLTVMYKFYERDRAIATFNGQTMPRSEGKSRAETAYKRWQEDAYRIAFPYKMKDPGAILKVVGKQPPLKGKCDPGCQVVEVTFQQGVGTDKYTIAINDTTNMPDIVETVMSQGSIGYAIDGFEEVGGLKFPSKFRNLGLETEKIAHTGIEVSAPDDSLYIPQVR